MTEPMVDVQEVYKSFRTSGRFGMFRKGMATPPFAVLTGVSIAVQEGDFLALLGANGVGKTTMLKMVATLLLPDAGSVRVMGIEAGGHEGRRVREKVGYVMADERSFHWRLSAAENLDFFARLDGIRDTERRGRINHLLRRLDLDSAGQRPFGQFSTGMKQRLAVARALLKRPRVLLMDEPTRSIDAAHAADVWRLVREEVADADGCLVLVTHQIQEALSLCSRVAILADGRVVLDSPARAMERYTSGLDGFTVAVRGLAAGGLDQLRALHGVRDVRVASQIAGEQTIEVWGGNGELPIASFIGQITDMGATVCSLQRSTPLQGVMERLLANRSGGTA